MKIRRLQRADVTTAARLKRFQMKTPRYKISLYPTRHRITTRQQPQAGDLYEVNRRTRSGPSKSSELLPGARRHRQKKKKQRTRSTFRNGFLPSTGSAHSRPHWLSIVLKDPPPGNSLISKTLLRERVQVDASSLAGFC